MTEEKEKVGPRVFSKKNIADQFVNFSIVVGEVKHLPLNYKESKLITHSLKLGDLEFLNNQTIAPLNKIDKSITLDAKDTANFLNQNTSSVIKQLRVNELSKKDLSILIVSETKNKKRKKILDFIKSLQKVS